MLANAERIVLTGGNIRNGYIRIRQFNSLISEHTMASDDKFLLELEGVGEIETQIDRKKGIFVERKAIKRFFQVHNLKPGEEISAEKIDENRFIVTVDPKKDNTANLSKLKKNGGELERQDSYKEQAAQVTSFMIK